MNMDEFDTWWAKFVEDTKKLSEFEQHLEIDKLGLVWEMDWDFFWAVYISQTPPMSDEEIARKKKDYFDNYRRRIWDAFQYVPCGWSDEPLKPLPPMTWFKDD